jgi:hypothetical protein
MRQHRQQPSVANAIKFMATNARKIYKTSACLFCSDRSLHDEARAEVTLRVEFLDVGKEDLCGRFLDETDLDEHRHLVDDECAPERVGIQVVGVSQKGFGPNILQACCMEVAGQIATDDVIIDRFPEDTVERVASCRPARANDEERQPFNRADPSTRRG